MDERPSKAWRQACWRSMTVPAGAADNSRVSAPACSSAEAALGVRRVPGMERAGCRRAGKGRYHLCRADLETGLCACLALLLPEDLPRDEEEARWLARRFPGRAWIAVELLRGGRTGRAYGGSKAWACRSARPGLGYEPYFLTVEDIVRFARTQGILCQGRGSAANSAVCYCLGITEVDPARIGYCGCVLHK